MIDRKRMENGAFLDEDYFERLLEEIREIRLSERRLYQTPPEKRPRNRRISGAFFVFSHFFERLKRELAPEFDPGDGGDCTIKYNQEINL